MSNIGKNYDHSLMNWSLVWNVTLSSSAQRTAKLKSVKLHWARSNQKVKDGVVEKDSNDHYKAVNE